MQTGVGAPRWNQLLVIYRSRWEGCPMAHGDLRFAFFFFLEGGGRWGTGSGPAPSILGFLVYGE